MTPINSPDKNSNIIFWVIVLAFIISMRTLYPEPATANTNNPPQPPEEIATILHDAEQLYDLPHNLAVSVAWYESSYTPTARSKYVGKYRSRGLMQLHQKYERYIVENFTDIPYDDFDWKNPKHNAMTGCGYLSYLIRRFDGSLYYAVLAYNWGEGNVSGLLRGDIGEDKIPARCKKYADNVLCGMDWMNEGGGKMTETEQAKLLDEASRRIRAKIIQSVGSAAGTKLHDELHEIIMSTKVPSSYPIDQELLDCE